ncbi:hypothetical protein, partial [Paenibacillus sp. HB172176]|uniref:hypothetical protein n=1 Tax=Paenibacillus sp. HB172176 TaxID=2493690 RepID=UPI00197F836D
FFETSDFREVGLFFARNHHTIHYAAFIFVLNLPHACEAALLRKAFRSLIFERPRVEVSYFF